jgi:hypothetical protein
VTSSQHNPSGEALSEEAAVAAAIEGHYGAIGAGNFEGAYSYFGPTFRGQHDQASWIAGEKSYEIQSSTIHSFTVDEVLGTMATATVDVFFVDNTGTPRFVIVWSLVKEGGQWKLDHQLSAQRVTEPQPDISSAPIVAPTASPSASPTPADVGIPHVRTGNDSFILPLNSSDNRVTSVVWLSSPSTPQKTGYIAHGAARLVEPLTPPQRGLPPVPCRTFSGFMLLPVWQLGLLW